ncbi:uncharacterized protein LOC101848590 [Aplysia californica]|uniref:glutathione-specific gamma-glutamylcyclotransferase n=1 Tax=Aplysia californica TaxID=6500 RepID=A0ABM0JQK3_APLCA|nr:uncharacterized protein LOC101848590 [Aplysia californica]
MTTEQRHSHSMQQSDSNYEQKMSSEESSDLDPVSALLGEHPTIWVFGYGSLLWKPDFQYRSKHIGYIEGYTRRFHQGNETFRGRPGKPGRVANLEEQEGSQTWGVAYEISGREEVASVLQALYTRETACGGYTTLITTFFPREYSTHRRPASLPPDHTQTHTAQPHNIPQNMPQTVPCYTPGLQPHYVTESSTSLTSVEDVDIGATSSDIDSSLSAEDVRRLFGDHSPPAQLRRTDSDISDFSNSDVSSIGDEEQDVSVYIGEDTSEEEKSVNPQRFFDTEVTSTFNSLYENMDETDHDELVFYIDRNKPSKESVPMTLEPVSLSGDTKEGQKPKAVHAQRRYTKSKSLTESKKAAQSRLSPIQALVYTATPDNDLYLGPGDITSMAQQISTASGSTGTNVEYVTKIADYVRQYIPEDNDTHLFALDAKIREEVYKQHAKRRLSQQTDLHHFLPELNDIEHESLTETVTAS